MNAVEEIDKVIETLPREDFMRLRDWVQRRFDESWDKEFELDAAEGRLDTVAEAAIAEYRAGRTSELGEAIIYNHA